jgi:hypothetical protein
MSYARTQDRSNLDRRDKSRWRQVKPFPILNSAFSILFGANLPHILPISKVLQLGGAESLGEDAGGFEAGGHGEGSLVKDDRRLIDFDVAVLG